MRALNFCCFLVLGIASALPVARAEEASAHYDPDRIVTSSALFLSLNKRSMEVFGPVESALARMDSALAALDLSLAVSDGAIDSAHHDLWEARLDERAQTFGNAFMDVQGRFDQDGRRYEEIFGSALVRALEALEAEFKGGIAECAAGGGDPFDMKGPGGSGAANCSGEDVSARIAGLWDADAVLAADLDAIHGEPWPAIASYDEPSDALIWIGGGAVDAALDGWVDPARIVESIPETIEIVDAIGTRAERARRMLRAEKDSIDPQAEDAEARVASVAERAKRITKFDSDQKAELGVALWAGFGRVLKKNRALKKKNIGLCMNPEDWGGCQGEDLTDAVSEALAADRKLQRILGKQLEAMGRPNVGAN